MASTTAYARPSKLPGAGPGERRPAPPRLIRAFLASGAKIEPRKLGAGLLAGCCLALLTYVSLAKLYAVYSPVFATTSALLQNAPPSSSSAAPGAVAAPRPPEEPAFAGGKNGSAVDRADLTEKGPATAGSREPGVPEAVSRKEHAEKAPAPANTSAPMPSDGERKSNSSSNVGAGPMSCDENGMDEGFPYARPAVCELSGDIRVSPSQKTMYLLNPSSGGGFDEKGEKRLRPYARNDDFLLPAVVEVTVKSVASPEAAPQCTKQHRVPAVVFSVAGYTDNFFHDNTDALIPLFLTTAHLKGEDEVAAAASELGFNVTVAEAGDDVPAFAALVNSADVLLAVHGAGLTNQIFLPTNGVVLQIVPWGNMDWMATNFYGQPARDMQLRYVEYYIDEEETSLKDKYPRDHVVFKDPKALHKQGWQALADTIMKQDVKVNITRFQPFLLQAMDELQE
ncbi:unnamed protein product [Triticum turgidum subsp. durum]|uniref:Glycosyltransferase 61 catalytic domain-containing protein n=1 Tax=Triticum turgidum subsp. durum TaxID=4567 RepID=A0A9R0R9S7_TRITD|nr:unnamed protein product [Triticum turgidum subsp. durum]